MALVSAAKASVAGFQMSRSDPSAGSQGERFSSESATAEKAFDATSEDGRESSSRPNVQLRSKRFGEANPRPIG